MVKNSLVENDIKDGAKLISKLDQSGLDITVALWLYQEDLDEWRLVISSPKLAEERLRMAYRKVFKILDEMGYTNIKSQDISIIRPSNRLIQSLDLALDQKPQSLDQGIKVSGTFNGIYIEDAYIYRLQTD
ncbi:hypothetical protein P5641_07980 [Bacillus subtilis]|uniref:Uncharacterized protein n=1 Tax=Bacillus subtilis TaxID=1423 RepID=A0AC61YZA4_BACIU|nr:hypothetical protein [Bacillus subtilis]OTQ84505.1 hypothetical protein BG30_13405 [Bacillus subtilis subsp. subtilis]MED3600996.1 hypothetical protein [Bacillus subtilis]MED3629370.1 hypothetical protein [Bacillus subtilis]MED3694175.1 hypothetical protein [Bacillus subtilis]